MKHLSRLDSGEPSDVGVELVVEVSLVPRQADKV